MQTKCIGVYIPENGCVLESQKLSDHIFFLSEDTQSVYDVEKFLDIDLIDFLKKSICVTKITAFHKSDIMNTLLKEERITFTFEKEHNKEIFMTPVCTLCLGRLEHTEYIRDSFRDDFQLNKVMIGREYFNNRSMEVGGKIKSLEVAQMDKMKESYDESIEKIVHSFESKLLDIAASEDKRVSDKDEETLEIDFC